MQFPIECALCGAVSNIHVTHSHLRVAHGLTTAEYRALGHSPTNPDFYAARSVNMSMENHPYWRGGRRVAANGYVYIRRDGDYVLEHRAVMEAHLGRKLATSEHVHHKDGVRTNNALENLEVIDGQAHVARHLGDWWADNGPRRERKARTVLTCAQCGSQFSVPPSRLKAYPGTRFCSRGCHTAARREQSASQIRA